MISFEKGNVQFNYRIVGIVFDNDRVLLHKAEQEDFWTLPGGRGELLEPAEETLKREMREELGAEIRVERLVWVVENFFEYEQKPWHELALYFQMSFPHSSPLYRKDDPFLGNEDGTPLIFQWYHLDDLENVPLYPSFLRQALTNIPDSTEHVIHQDGKLPDS